MSSNSSLGAARDAKYDEFYTQYSDVEAEMNAYYEFDHNVFRGKTVLLPCDDHEWSNFTKYFAANFERFGLKKLISTSYAKSSGSRQISMFELDSPLYDVEKHDTHGKLFVLTRDINGDGLVDGDDVEFKGYLDGDGSFRSKEVTKLRDEADIIITNPPFSLFREFMAWVYKSEKQFIVLGNMNCITYKEIFPLLKENRMWIGYRSMNKDMYFNVPEERQRWLVENKKEGSAYKIIDGTVMGRLACACWFTNIDNGRRHVPMMLDTMEHNLKFNKKLKNKLTIKYGDATKYPHYDNYEAIDVPLVECIPSDYTGVMGVPVSFMDKHMPAQFEIIGADYEYAEPVILSNGKRGTGRFYIDEKRLYSRILIRHKLVKEEGE